jgi:hypothetical protein
MEPHSTLTWPRFTTALSAQFYEPYIMNIGGDRTKGGARLDRTTANNAAHN